MKLEGKVSLVTGAASGIGQACALLFAEEGAKVVAVDKNIASLKETVKQINDKNGQAIDIYCDLVKPTDIKNMINEAVSKYGTIDIACNCAGVLDDYKDVVVTDEELWDEVINTNLKANYLIAHLVVPMMVEKGKGNIINIASISSFVAGGGGVAYTASKHGLVGLTKQITYNFGKKGVRANTICPANILTGMTKEIFADPDAPVMELVRSVPAGRIAQAIEVAKVALFLASDDSDFIHGANIMIDGGWTVK